LNKAAPFHRAIERLGAIMSHPILDGLHHQYCRQPHSASRTGVPAPARLLQAHGVEKQNPMLSQMQARYFHAYEEHEGDGVKFRGFVRTQVAILPPL
jgi:hypothetical protein